MFEGCYIEISILKAILVSIYRVPDLLTMKPFLVKLEKLLIILSADSKNIIRYEQSTNYINQRSVKLTSI